MTVLLESAYGSFVAPAVGAFALICCCRRVKVDVTLVPCTRDDRFCSNMPCFTIEHQHFLLRLPAWFLLATLALACLQITPRLPSDYTQSAPHLSFGPPPPKRFGHNLQHMALFEALTSGFGMVFPYATLIFLTLDPIFGAPGQGLGPGRPGAPFWATTGPENRDFVEGLVPHEVSHDFL